MQKQQGKQPLNVHLYVTPICNLQCKHCYYDALGFNSDPGRLLTTREIALIITDLCDDYEADFHVEGGELFLRDDLEKLFHMVPDFYWKNVTFTTSGTVKLKVAYEYLRMLGDLRISVEGHIDELQRELRGVPLAPVLKTCSELHKNDVPFTIRITLYRHNFDQLAEMLEFYQSIGANQFSFFEFQPVGRGASSQDLYNISTLELESVLQTLVSCPLSKKIRTFKLSLSPNRIPLVQKYQEGLETQGYEIINLSGIPSLTINSNGDIGVSPWKATAAKISDRFAVLDQIDLKTEVAKQIQEGQLNELCGHCSEVLIRYKGD